jgi:hypothetical protein
VRSALANLSPASLPSITPPNPLPPVNPNPAVTSVATPSAALREALSQYANGPTPPFPFPTTVSPTGGTAGSAARSRAARVLASALSQAFDASDSLFGAWGGVEASPMGGHGEGVPVLVDAQGELMTGKKGLDKAGQLVASGVGGRVVPREEDIGSVMGKWTRLLDWHKSIYMCRVPELCYTTARENVSRAERAAQDDTHHSSPAAAGLSRHGQGAADVLPYRTSGACAVVRACARGRRRGCGGGHERAARGQAGADMGLAREGLRQWVGCAPRPRDRWGRCAGESRACRERGGGVDPQGWAAWRVTCRRRGCTFNIFAVCLVLLAGALKSSHYVVCVLCSTTTTPHNHNDQAWIC